MALDAFTAGVLRLMAAAYPDLGGTVTDAVEARERYGSARYPAGPAVASVVDQVIPGPQRIPVRIYRPLGAAATGLPVVTYLHGGGFVMCDLDTHDNACRAVAAGLPAIVVSVDYRLAPEHPFPAGPDDAYAATCWVADQAASWGGDPARLIVAGDSAGGALAAATCLRARDLGGPPISAQLLIYPVTDCLAPRLDVGDSLLTSAHMRWYTEQYLARPADAEHPYASPLRAPDLTGLPPAVIVTAEHDPLRVEGEAFADALRQAGVAVVEHHIPGLFHGLFGLGALVPVARQAEVLACTALRQVIQPTGNSTHHDWKLMELQPTTLSATIGEVMGAVLVRKPLDADEDFFNCGGDSLRAIEVLQRLATHEELADRLGSTDMQAFLLESIFEHSSPAGLASVVAARA
ncbi:acetyl esterase [Allocatelliglobosispora scoriae]|uniref:Acetyl esterase n=1 Tax=Allocatelliglobosispora scoriae TaxID=643052 RepID=A0A841BRL6_9ACTN|nr:alpha/beta hydrolase fold domain-containing protein [Allocatelliglobosispora scoriae]MBB5870026.1 acetyl esterase [Allocatelliglobosispora scoriae]